MVSHCTLNNYSRRQCRTQRPLSGWKSSRRAHLVCVGLCMQRPGYLGQQGLQGGVVGKRHQQNFSVGSAKHLVEKLAESLQDFLLTQTPFPVVEEHLLVAYGSLLKVHRVVQGGKGPLCNWCAIV